MLALLRARLQWQAGLITLGDFLAILYRFMDSPLAADAVAFEEAEEAKASKAKAEVKVKEPEPKKEEVKK
jgi:hypothetical protein